MARGAGLRHHRQIFWGLDFYGLGVYLHALSRRPGGPAGVISVAVTVYYVLSAGGIVAVGGLSKRSQGGSDFDFDR